MSKTRIGIALGAATLFALAGCATTGGGADSKANVAPDKVVYHINDTGAQAVAALRNIGNHLEVNPQAKIVVVTHAQGVDFLMEATFVPSGVAEITRLQQREGYAYLRP